MKKVICITGGAGSLGRECAAFFSRQSQVIIFDINEKVLETVAKKFDCDYQVCDVSNSNQVNQIIKEVFKKYGRIDCFINCAGLFIDEEIESNNPDLIKKVFDVNIIGPIYTTQVLVPIFKKQKFGTIVNINSTAGLHPKPFNSVYHASKWALTGFSQSVQAELASFGIKIIDIHPGDLKNKFNGPNYDISRALEPHQVVKTIDFLLSLDQDTIIPELTIKHL